MLQGYGVSMCKCVGEYLIANASNAPRKQVVAVDNPNDRNSTTPCAQHTHTLTREKNEQGN